MGKGKPSPRETAKEKKTAPRKAVAAKASSKKAEAAQSQRKRTSRAAPGLESKKPSPVKAGKAGLEKAAGDSAGGNRPAKTEKAAAPGGSHAAPAATLPAKEVERVAPQKPLGREASVQKPSIQTPSVQEAAGREPAAQIQSEPGPRVQPDAQPAAQPDERDGVRLPTAGGKVGVFGGPKDRSVKPDDKLGLPTGRHYQYEQFRSLNPKGYYCAMRWEYRQQHMSAEEGKRWWANKKIAVTNPANNKVVVVRAVDYGPHETSGLAIAISPGAAEAIGVEVGQEVMVAFADEKAPLGPASNTLSGAAN